MPEFFPDLSFAWLFYGGLVLFLAASTYADLRWLVIPKKITVASAIAALVLHMARGAWLGATDRPTWLFGAHGAFVGLLDGMLFALAGFAAGFGLFFVLWILGACGGGDVKIFAAVAAWVGPYHALWILAGSTCILVCLALIRTVLLIAAGGRPKLPSPARLSNPGTKPKSPPRYARLMAYSVPLGLAASVMTLWFYRYELRLAEPPSSGGAQAQMVGLHAN